MARAAEGRAQNRTANEAEKERGAEAVEQSGV